MKVGDLVVLNSESDHVSSLYGEDIFEGTSGIILEALHGGSHRKNSSYLVLWPPNASKHIHKDNKDNTRWYTGESLKLA